MKNENVKNKFNFIKKEDGKSKEDVIFFICAALIILLSLFIIVYPTPFYQKIDKTMENNVNLNIQIKQDEKLQEIIKKTINEL